jgi:hypothetical protein
MENEYTTNDIETLEDEMFASLEKYFQSQIEKHVINVKILMKERVGVAEHPDIMLTIEGELEKIAGYSDKLDALGLIS